jgi:hypothetical protein
VTAEGSTLGQLDASAFGQLVYAVHQRFADPTVEYYTGKEGLDLNTSPRRIVWLHAGGKVSPTRVSGRRLSADGAYYYTPLYAAEADVRAHIWAPNYPDAEALWVRLLSAVKGELCGASTPGEYAIPTQDERAGFTHADYTLFVQAFTWSMMVSAAEPGATQIAPTIHGSQAVVLIAQTHVCSILP